MGKKLVVSAGDIYGRLTIIKEIDRGKRGRRFECKCECGNFKIVYLSNITCGDTKSCGCLNKEIIKEKQTKHGLYGHPIYIKWIKMNGRCYNKNNKDYELYGGRGIKVCNEWKGDFKTFYDWSLENGWEGNLEIDRINNDGNYEPSNCRFISHQQNSLNRNKFRNNTTGYRGVLLDKKYSKYSYQIRSNGKIIKSKYGFKTAEAAAIARDKFIIDNNLPHPLNFTYLEPNLQSPNGWMII